MLTVSGCGVVCFFFCFVLQNSSWSFSTHLMRDCLLETANNSARLSQLLSWLSSLSRKKEMHAGGRKLWEMQNIVHKPHTEKRNTTSSQSNWILHHPVFGWYGRCLRSMSPKILARSLTIRIVNSPSHPGYLLLSNVLLYMVPKKGPQNRRTFS